MSKRVNFTFLLLVILLNIVFTFNVNIAANGYNDYDILRDVDINRSKNILLGSYVDGRSHLNPMLDIAEILIERGYNIILLTSGNYTSSSEYPTIKQISFGPSPNPMDFSDKKFDFRKFKIVQEVILESYNGTFEKYKKVVKDYNIDLLICYVMVNDACLDVAHTLKKPIVGFSPIISAIVPKTYKSDPIFDCNISLENESFLERLKCTLIQPIRLVYLIYPYANQLNDLRKSMNVEPTFMAMRRLPKTTLVLVDTFFGFELPQSLPPNVQEIGPVLSKEYPPLTPELNDFINGRKRVLYVSFGTRFFMGSENNIKILQSLVEAINKNLFDGIIWALVKTSKDNFPSTLDLTDGTKIQTSPILNNENPNIRIIKFAPQFSILNHTNTKLFLSHGGVGSSHESLYTGTPILVLPIAGDQMGNGEKLKLSGVALTLNKFNLNVNDILNRMNFLLNDKNVKKNSKRMEVLAKINSKRKYRAADLIEYVLHTGSNFNDIGGVNEEFLKEWIPADIRMGIIRGNNYDVYGIILSIIFGIIGGILWIMFKLIRFIVKKIPSLKPKRD